jgi:hypothetical protein
MKLSRPVPSIVPASPKSDAGYEISPAKSHIYELGPSIIMTGGLGGPARFPQSCFCLEGFSSCPLSSAPLLAK